MDDLEAMPAPRFFSMAYRIGAYPGVISALHRIQAHKRAERSAPMSAGDFAAMHPDAMAAAAQRLARQQREQKG